MADEDENHHAPRAEDQDYYAPWPEEEADSARGRPSVWWSLSRPGGGGVHIKVSHEENRWVITDVYVHGKGVTASALQSVPLTQLDLAMNLLTFADPRVIARVGNDLGQAVLAETAHEPSLASLRQRAKHAPSQLPAPTGGPRPKLTRPDGTDPEGFSARVAAAYREYAPQTRAPALKIAEEAGVPVATARSWIREARRRGKLPQGRKGRAG
jgi:hypothetical protein